MRFQRYAFLLIILLLLSLSGAAQADGGMENYSAYLEAWGGKEQVTASFPLYTSEGKAFSEGDSFTFSFSAPQDMFGYPVFTYRVTGNNILDNAYSLLLDGETPYQECGALKLESQWLMNGPFEKDRYDNEVVSMPIKDTGVLQCRMLGKAGLYSRGSV